MPHHPRHEEYLKDHEKGASDSHSNHGSAVRYDAKTKFS